MLKFNIDPKDILAACKDSQEEVKKALTKGVKDLAVAAQGHIVELAKGELSPALFKIFKGDQKEPTLRIDTIDANTHVITLSGSAYWIEEGIEPGSDMKTDKWLFKSKKTRTSKEGYRYLFVPFEHSAPPSTQTGYEKGLTDRVKFELKAKNKQRKQNGLSQIPWMGIERDEHGKPKEGLIHEFDFKGTKAKDSWTSNPLERLRVYQAVERDKEGKAKLTKGGKEKVTRSWMTFRTASENPKSKDKFIHPGYTGNKFMDKTKEWAETEFYGKILPDIFAKWKD